MQSVDGQIDVCDLLIWESFYAKNEIHRQMRYGFAAWERAWDWKTQYV